LVERPAVRGVQRAGGNFVLVTGVVMAPVTSQPDSLNFAMSRLDVRLPHRVSGAVRDISRALGDLPNRE
jgi:hypothetical protein